MTMLTSLFLVLLVLVSYGIEGSPLNDRDEQDLVDILRNTLSVYKTARENTLTGSVRSRENAEIRPIVSGNGYFDGNRIKELEAVYNFPGSNFVMEIVQRWLEADFPGNIDEIKDFTGVDDGTLSHIENLVGPLLHVIGADNEGFAEFMTRSVTKAVFDAHVSCPSSLINKFLALKWRSSEASVLGDRTDLATIFKPLITKFFPTFEETPELMEDMVDLLVTRTNERLMRDTEQFILALGFLDVARFSHNLYKTLVGMEDIDTVQFDFKETVKRTIVLTRVGCQRGIDVFGYHDMAIELLLIKFESLELQPITETFYEILSDSVDDIVSSDNVEDPISLLATINWTVIDDMAEGVLMYVKKEVVPELENLLLAIDEQNTLEFIGLFDFLDQGDRLILFEVLKRLGWSEVPDVNLQRAVTLDAPTTWNISQTDSRKKAIDYLRERFHHWMKENSDQDLN